MKPHEVAHSTTRVIKNCACLLDDVVEAGSKDSENGEEFSRNEARLIIDQAKYIRILCTQMINGLNPYVGEPLEPLEKGGTVVTTANTGIK